MSITSYTMGNNNAFAFGSSAKVTAGLSNTMTLGASNSMTVGTTTSLQAGGSVAASIGGSVAWSYAGALTIASGPALSLSQTQTTRARDTVTLTAGCGDVASAAWTLANATLGSIQKALLGLAGANLAIGALAAGMTPLTDNKTGADLADFDNNKRLLATTMSTSLGAILANVAFGASLAKLMRTLSEGIDAVQQVATLNLDKDGARLTGDFGVGGTESSSLTLASDNATLNRVANAGTVSNVFSMKSDATSVGFETGADTPMGYMPLKAASLTLAQSQASLGTGTAYGDPNNIHLLGPSFVLSAADNSVKAYANAAVEMDSIALSPGSLMARIGPTSQTTLALGEGDAKLAYAGQSISFDATSATLTGAEATLALTAEGAKIGAQFIQLG